MKKAKIMLTAVAVFALVGGALAFKASRVDAQVFCAEGTDGFCNDRRADFTLAVQAPPAQKIENTHCTNAQVNATCAATTIYALD